MPFVPLSEQTKEKTFRPLEEPKKFTPLGVDDDPTPGILGALSDAARSTIAGRLATQQPTPPPSEKNFIERVARGAGTIFGDIPVYGIGAALGTGSGGPGIGTAAGAFGLQGGLSKVLDDRYGGGPIKSAGQFAERLGGALTETVKGQAIGAATGAAGRAVRTFAPLRPSWLIGSENLAGATAPAEIGAMLTTQSILEGRVPSQQEVIDVVATVGVLHGVNAAMDATSKSPVGERYYLETGETPVELFKRVEDGKLPITPPPSANNMFGIKPVSNRLVTAEVIGNAIKNVVNKPVRWLGGTGFVEKHPLSTPIMKMRTNWKNNISSQAAANSASADAIIRDAFKLDKRQLIPELSGIDPSIPGAPSLQDVAARLPVYAPHLTERQLAVLDNVRGMLDQYSTMLSDIGESVGTRPDIMQGGFYIPRGRADVEGADMPVKITSGRTGAARGYEKPAVFDSQAEGVAAGYEYAPIHDVISRHITAVGNRVLDTHVSNYFKTLTDETGKLIGETPKMRMERKNPELVERMDSLKKNLTRLKNLEKTLSDRQQATIESWLHDPNYESIDALFYELSTDINPTVQRGRNAGADRKEIRRLLNTTKAEIVALRPDYNDAMARAKVTPRDQSALGLPRMEGWTFPDEIASTVNVLMNKEGPTKGRLKPAVDAFNAFSNIYRGMRATLDNSAIGIQGLLGLGANPKAYKDALVVNAKAWGLNGEKALGSYINDVNSRSAQNGRLTVQDWTNNGLHISGGEHEFSIGQGITPRLSDVPGIRQANRAFGYFGDALRIGWADGELARQMQKRSLKEIQNSGDLAKIAESANAMTGWVPSKTFGSVGEIVFFAPRWLQSQLTTIAKASAGLRPDATLDQRMARQAMLRFIGGATMMTFAINEALGNDTDARPIVNGKRNSDFMRIAYGERKYSLLGPWDSLLGAIINVGTGSPLRALRSKASGPVAMGWDLITGRDYNYKPVSDSPQALAMWLGESFVPFAASQIPEDVGLIKEGVTKDDTGKIAGGATSLASQFFGIKNYPVSSLYEVQKKWEGDIKEYDNIPTNANERRAKGVQSRQDYRRRHPETEAKLFITGKVNSLTTSAAAYYVDKLIKENDIDYEEIPGVAAYREETESIKQYGVPDTRNTYESRLIRALDKSNR